MQTSGLLQTMNRLIAALALLQGTALAKSDITCGLDAHIINETTFPLIREDLAGSLLAAMCGANRGLFVTTPGDGHVYGCGLFPPQWANEKVEHCATHPCACATWDANAVVQQYDGGNLTATEAVDMYDQYVAAVYASSPEKEKDVRACDAGGFAVLSGAACVAPSDTYRAVTLRGIAGLDGNGHTVAHTPHSSKDYEAIQALGLDSVRIPVKAEDVKQFDTGDLRVILAVYGDAVIDLDGVALVEADETATEVLKAAKAAGVPVLLRLESEAALNSYAGTDGVAYAISRVYLRPPCLLPDGVRPSAHARSDGREKPYMPRTRLPPQTRPRSSTSRRARRRRTAPSSSTTRPPPVRNPRPSLLNLESADDFAVGSPILRNVRQIIPILETVDAEDSRARVTARRIATARHSSTPQAATRPCPASWRARSARPSSCGAGAWLLMTATPKRASTGSATTSTTAWRAPGGRGTRRASRRASATPTSGVGVWAGPLGRGNSTTQRKRSCTRRCSRSGP